ncbi:MAG: DUF1501 domain-containing protein [Paludisphaera borealis]|uniref:DUF1501 domain-containing protein n=1 Tax=Paludisphaera borealis TaxID=1387353 RepID=UPI00284BA934|nr:DUF1501 domain-containing protein [Paludisphaera borealis]MDR3618032.1 DUF1501 domain-containing protein [Paludisphaera borealis]
MNGEALLYPCGRVSRRGFLRGAGGFLGVALGGLWSEAGEIEGALHGPHFAPKAKSVIFLFMCGGVSHIDTFDPKDNKWAGKLIDAVGFGDNSAEMRRPVIHCDRKFTRYGESGIPVSDWFPHVGGVVDEIAMIRSMWCHEGNHFPAVIETCTGHRGRPFDHPTLGGWISYALGSANQNLPTFVNIGRPSSPVQLTGGYLGATVAATPFQAGETPIPNLKPPRGTGAADRERRMEALADLNREFRDRYALESDIAARTKAYELAARMQLSAPEAVDVSSEPKHVLDLYGIGDEATDDFGRQLLMARRLAERGVRFVQVCHAGGGNGAWDAHGDIRTHAPLCRSTDKPIAGLIRDLKSRGLLDDTLVVWTSEFGRSPWSQNTTGRDHNPRGYTAWLAGGGVKGGTVHGATDDVGYKAVESPHYYSDLHATILHQLGLDHKKMEIPVLGRTMRLVEEGKPIKEVLT